MLNVPRMQKMDLQSSKFIFVSVCCAFVYLFFFFFFGGGGGAGGGGGRVQNLFLYRCVVHVCIFFFFFWGGGGGGGGRVQNLFLYRCVVHVKQVNINKTKIVTFNKSGKLLKRQLFFYGEKTLENVQEFKYLGIIIKSSGIFSKGISELSNKALKVLFMIKRKFQSSFIFPTLQIRLFDACVKPILLYCCELWSPYSININKILSSTSTYYLEESYEDFLPEKIHTKFCKFLIGVNKYSSNLACKSEVGRYPLAISAMLLSLKYWLHIHNDKDPKMVDRFSYQSILNTNGIALSYNNQIKNFLEIIGFEHTWQNKGTFSKLKLVHAVKVNY